MAPTANADFMHLMSGAKVPKELVDKFVEAGVDNVRDFAAAFKDVEDLHRIVKKEFGLDPDASQGERMKVARLAVAWETAKGRSAKMVELEAEAESRKEPKHVPTQDHKAMKKAFEDQHWTLTDEGTPSQRFMEKRLDMIEKCQWKAEPLSEVLGVLEDEDPMDVPRVDAKGNFVTVKMGNTVALPRNMEQLRFRIDLWGRSWIFAAALHTNRTELVNLAPPVFTNYGNHMLGKHVLGLLSDGPWVA